MFLLLSVTIKVRESFRFPHSWEMEKIRKTIIDFLSAAGGKELNSDLVVYIGHNGLMDTFQAKAQMLSRKESRKHTVNIRNAELFELNRLRRDFYSLEKTQKSQNG